MAAIMPTTTISVDELSAQLSRIAVGQTGLVDTMRAIEAEVSQQTTVKLEIGGIPSTKFQEQEVNSILAGWQQNLCDTLPKITLDLGNRSFSLAEMQRMAPLIKSVSFSILSVIAPNIYASQDQSGVQGVQQAANGQPFVGHLILQELANALEHANQLRSIDFSRNAINPTGFQHLRCLLSPRLTSINLTDAGLDSDCMAIIRQALLNQVGTCNLLELFCSGNKVGEVGGQEIGLLIAGCPQLMVLSCGDCRFGLCGSSSIARGLNGLLHLRELNLECCQFGNSPQEALGQLCKALESMHHLEKLSLSDCGLDVSGLSLVRTSLVKSQARLVELKLDYLSLGDKNRGLAMLLSLLKRYTQTLKTLSLAGNDLGSEGLANLIPFFSDCNTLDSVDLSGNDLGPEAVSILLSIPNPWRALVLAENGLQDEILQQKLGVHFDSIDFGVNSDGYYHDNDGWIDDDGNFAPEDGVEDELEDELEEDE